MGGDGTGLGYTWGSDSLGPNRLGQNGRPVLFSLIMHNLVIPITTDHGQMLAIVSPAPGLHTRSRTSSNVCLQSCYRVTGAQVEVHMW